MMTKSEKKRVNIVIPMAGSGNSFFQAGYSFPKPLIDVDGKPMIQAVSENLKPKVPYRFIFVCKKEDYEKFSLLEIFERSVGKNFEVIQLTSPTGGAACTVLTATDYINNEEELIVANADQVVDININKFIKEARKLKADGTIMTFKATHPKWSFVRIDKNKNVLEIVEKKVISDHATVGIYYFKHGKDFVEAAVSMIEKDIKFNGSFYASLVYNEMIMGGKKIKSWSIKPHAMHSMATPEDLMRYIIYLMYNKK